jgi:hypothetical protein
MPTATQIQEAQQKPSTVSRQSFVKHPVVSSSRVPCTTAPRFSLFSNDHPGQRTPPPHSFPAQPQTELDRPEILRARLQGTPPCRLGFHTTLLSVQYCKMQIGRSVIMSGQADRFGRACEWALPSPSPAAIRASRLAGQRREFSLTPLSLQARRLE